MPSKHFDTGHGAGDGVSFVRRHADWVLGDRNRRVPYSELSAVFASASLSHSISAYAE